MKSFCIRIGTYGTDNPEFVESSAIDASERGENYLNPDEFMLFGVFENVAAAKQAHAEESADNAYCKAHDC